MKLRAAVNKTQSLYKRVYCFVFIGLAAQKMNELNCFHRSRDETSSVHTERALFLQDREAEGDVTRLGKRKQRWWDFIES